MYLSCKHICRGISCWLRHHLRIFFHIHYYGKHPVLRIWSDIVHTQTCLSNINFVHEPLLNGWRICYWVTLLIQSCFRYDTTLTCPFNVAEIRLHFYMYWFVKYIVFDNPRVFMLRTGDMSAVAKLLKTFVVLPTGFQQICPGSVDNQLLLR